PYTIGSNTWGGATVRMATWVRFEDRRDGRRFTLLNTHLDHRSATARINATRLIVERLGGPDRSLPVVVTGDFNVPAHRDPVYDTLLAAGLVDS
ncbi:endonuclease/exonuclease/phosphatase family protein, partial [Streptomyces sp. URMC 126]